MKAYRITIDQITEREQEIIQLLAQGKTDQQIADILTISLRTAQNHMRNIREKVGVHTRTAVIAYAHHHHLISLNDEYFLSGN